MKISSINFNIFNASQTEFKKSKINQSDKPETKKSFSYPKNFYINFTSKAPKTILSEIKQEDFPSQEIFQKVKNAYRCDKNFSLYDTHIEYYSDLLKCDTLDEAKEIYPEFKDVSDAKDIELKTAPYSIRQVARGIRGIELENLSLDLLKKYYGQLFCVNHNKDNYYGCEAKAVKNMLKALNIPIMDSKYISILYHQQPSVVQNLSVKTKEFFQKHPEYAQAHSRFMQEYSQTSEARQRRAGVVYDEAIRAHMSQVKKDYHIAHPELAVEHGKYMKEYYANHPEAKEKLSNGQIKFNAQHKEYRLLKSLIVLKLFPDVQEKMKEIAQDFKGIASIRNCREQGIPLSSKQDIYDRIYFARCEKEFPGMKKQIGQVYSELIKRFGISKDCDSEEKIREIEEYFSDDENVKNLMLEFRGFIVE